MPLVQKAKAVSVTPLTGGDFGPGTRGMLGVTVSFSNPVINGNSIILAVMGNVPESGALVSRGPILAFVSFSGAHSGIFTTYYFAVSYTDAAGTETVATQYGAYSTDQTDVTLSQPNPNINIIPGAVSWSVYASKISPTTLKRLGSGIGPSAGFSSSLSAVGSGADPVSSPAQDTLGNTYVEAQWQDGNSSGNNNGENAMAFFVARTTGGSPVIKFVCGGFNAQPFTTQDGVLSIQALEWSGDVGARIDGGVVQQGDSGTGNISIPLTNSLAQSKTTAWLHATNSGQTAMVVDLSPGSGTDLFLAMFCNALGMGIPDPPTPSLTGGIYTFVDKVIPPGAPGSDNFPMWLWYSAVIGLTLACPSSAATEGVAYSSSFEANGGTPPYTFSISSGSLPPGLTLNTSTGAVTGTPTASGTFPYTGTVEDSASPPSTVSTSCSITVAPSGTITIACALTIQAQSPVLPEPIGCFELLRVVATMRPARHLPVRGSSK